MDTRFLERPLKDIRAGEIKVLMNQHAGFSMDIVDNSSGESCIKQGYSVTVFSFMSKRG